MKSDFMKEYFKIAQKNRWIWVNLFSVELRKKSFFGNFWWKTWKSQFINEFSWRIRASAVFHALTSLNRTWFDCSQSSPLMKNMLLIANIDQNIQRSRIDCAFPDLIRTSSGRKLYRNIMEDNDSRNWQLNRQLNRQLNWHSIHHFTFQTKLSSRMSHPFKDCLIFSVIRRTKMTRNPYWAKLFH
jgi:hypothetical protein